MYACNRLLIGYNNESELTGIFLNKVARIDIQACSNNKKIDSNRKKRQLLPAGVCIVHVK